MENIPGTLPGSSTDLFRPALQKSMNFILSGTLFALIYCVKYAIYYVVIYGTSVPASSGGDAPTAFVRDACRSMGERRTARAYAGFRDLVDDWRTGAKLRLPLGQIDRAGRRRRTSRGSETSDGRPRQSMTRSSSAAWIAVTPRPS